MIRFTFFVFLVVLAVPLAAALDCGEFGNMKTQCEEIVQSALSEQEKNMLLAELLNTDKDVPQHSFVREWNLDRNAKVKPENTAAYNSGVIKDAWVKVLTIMPSVWEEGSIYVPSQGEVFTSYNYRIELPSGALTGDCKTLYTLVDRKEELNVYLNGKLLGHEALTPFATQKDAEFKAEYKVTTRTQLERYRLQNNRCVYRSTQYWVDTIKVQDTKTAKYLASSLSASFSPLDEYLNTMKAKVSGKNYALLELQTSSGYFKDAKYVYSFVFENSPINTLQIKALPYQHLETQNVVFEGENPYLLYFPKSASCTLLVRDHFQKKDVPCNLAFESFSLRVETDKLSYEAGEQIRVKITPSDREVELNYAGESFGARGKATLEAKYPYNAITATFKEKRAEALIHVKNEKQFTLATFFVFFTSLNYVILKVVKRVWGGVLD